MAASDARPVPRKNAAYRVVFPVLDADGDLVAAAADLDSEISKDGGAMADCANEATEIGGSGLYYLDLTADEMNADCVAILVKTSTSGAKTTPIVLYPEEAGDIRVNVTEISTAQRNNVADAVLARSVANVEASAGEHTLCTIVLAMLESAVSGTDWTIKRTDGSTTHASKTVTTDANAEPITGVA